MSWTTDELIAKVRIYAFEPDAADGGLSAADIISLADDELQSYVFPRVLAANAEYRVYSETQAVVAGLGNYRIQYRAHAGRLRDVLWLDASGNARSLPLIDIDLLGSRYSAVSGGDPPQVAYLKDGDLCVYPVPASAVGSIVQKFYMRPGYLVAVAAATTIATVGAVDSGGAGKRRLTGGTVPAGWTTSTSLYDVVRGSGTFETSQYDLTAAAVTTGAAGHVDFTETDLVNTVAAVGATGAAYSTIKAADYICVAGQSCVPQIPDVVHPWLARRVALSLLEVRGDANAQAIAQRKCDEFEQSLVSLLKPRVDGEPMTITTPNGPFRAGRSWSRIGRMP